MLNYAFAATEASPDSTGKRLLGPDFPGEKPDHDKLRAWTDEWDSILSGTGFGPLLAGAESPALYDLRARNIDIELPAIAATADNGPAAAKRTEERRLAELENARRAGKRDELLRDLRNRLAQQLIPRLRPRANLLLGRLLVKHLVSGTVEGIDAVYDGVAMYRELRALRAAPASITDQNTKQELYETFVKKPLPDGAHVEDFCSRISYFTDQINPFIDTPLAGAAMGKFILKQMPKNCAEKSADLLVKHTAAGTLANHADIIAEASVYVQLKQTRQPAGDHVPPLGGAPTVSKRAQKRADDAAARALAASAAASRGRLPPGQKCAEGTCDRIHKSKCWRNSDNEVTLGEREWNNAETRAEIVRDREANARKKGRTPKPLWSPDGTTDAHAKGAHAAVGGAGALEQRLAAIEQRLVAAQAAPPAQPLGATLPQRAPATYDDIFGSAAPVGMFAPELASPLLGGDEIGLLGSPAGASDSSSSSEQAALQPSQPPGLFHTPERPVATAPPPTCRMEPAALPQDLTTVMGGGGGCCNHGSCNHGSDDGSDDGKIKTGGGVTTQPATEPAGTITPAGGKPTLARTPTPTWAIVALCLGAASFALLLTLACGMFAAPAAASGTTLAAAPMTVAHVWGARAQGVASLAVLPTIMAYRGHITAVVLTLLIVCATLDWSSTARAALHTAGAGLVSAVATSARIMRDPRNIVRSAVVALVVLCAALWIPQGEALAQSAGRLRALQTMAEVAPFQRYPGEVNYSLNAYLMATRDVTTMPCTMSAKDAAGIVHAMEFGSDLVMDASAADAARCAINDSGAGRDCVPPDCPYIVPGSLRANTTAVSTANGVVVPPHSCDVRLPVNVEGGGKRFLKLRNALVLDSCPHILISAGKLASEQGIGTWLAPWGNASYLSWLDARGKSPHRVLLHNAGVLILPLAAQAKYAFGGATSDGGSGGARQLTGKQIHDRYLHRSHRVLRHLPDCTKGAPEQWRKAIDKYADEPCHDCLRSTQNAQGSHQSAPAVTAAGQLVSFDMWTCGVGHVHGGQKIVMSFHDHYSHKNKPYLCGSYTDALACIKTYLAYCSAHSVTVRQFHTDNGTTFVAQDVRDYLKEQHIHLTTIAPGVSRQNGVCERQWRTMACDTRCLLARANMTRAFWWYALRHAASVAGLLPITGHPTECADSRFFGDKPTCTYVRTWGCLCYPKIWDGKTKVDMQSRPCIYLGRAPDQPAHLAYDPSCNKVYTTPFCTFVEDSFPGITKAAGGGAQVNPDFAPTYDPAAEWADFDAPGDDPPDDLADDELDPTAPSDGLQRPPQPQQQPLPQPPAAPRQRGHWAPSDRWTGRTRKASNYPSAATVHPALQPPDGEFIVYLGSGKPRDGDLPTQARAVKLGVLAIDIKRGGYAHDLTRDDVTEGLCAVAAMPHCVGILVSTPCGTWSAARFHDDQAPVLRDRDNLWGIPLDEAGTLPAKVARANALTVNALRVAHVAAARGLPVVIESPVPRGEGEQHAMPGREMHASMWSFPPMADFVLTHQCVHVDFDQCMCGAGSQKTTRLMCTPSAYRHVLERFGPRVCDGKHTHKELVGEAVGGEFKTSAAEEYPPQMNAQLASAFNATRPLASWAAYFDSAAGGVGRDFPASDAATKHAAEHRHGETPTPGLRAVWRDAHPERGTDTTAAPHSPRAVGTLPPIAALSQQPASSRLADALRHNDTGLEQLTHGQCYQFEDLLAPFSVDAYEGDRPSYKQTLVGPEAPLWQKSREEEWDNLVRHGVFEWAAEDSLSTWDAIKRRAYEVIDTLWVFLRKRDGDGNVCRYKGRCTLRGDQQAAKAATLGTELDTFAPAVRHTTFRLLNAAAAICKARVRAFDVEAAFLQGEPEEQVVYARPPPMGPIPTPKDDRGVPLVWKLKRPLYGEADAARIWYFTLHKQLVAQGFIRSEYDPCLYRKVYADGARIDLSIYVDDSWLVDTAGARADAELAELQKHFTLTITDDPKFFLGMNYARGRDGAVQFNSYAYVQKLVSKYLPKPLDSYRAYDRPADRTLHRAYEEALKLKSDNAEIDPELKKRYMSTVGALIYCSPSARPDVTQAVGLLARALTFPTPALMEAAHRVIAYLGQHPHDGLEFSGAAEDASVLEAFSDSDWSVTNSTSGWCIKLAGTVIAWSSRRQHSIAMSSTEAEVMAASEAALEIVYLRRILAELGLTQTAPTVLHVDNSGAVELAKDLRSCQRSRHIERRYLKVRELVEAGEIVVRYISTNDNPADMFTKSSLDGDHWKKHADAIMRRV